MAQNIGHDGNQSPMAADEDFDDMQEIINRSVRPSNSLPAMPSLVANPVPAQRRPHIRIVEEPASKTIRFRYKCEGRTAGSIPGENSKPDAKTFPTIMICDYEGPVNIVVSCVTKDLPHAQHPHHLVSKEEKASCRHGVYTKRLGPDERRLVLQKVGIQCVKKTEVRESLLERQEKNIDPFNAGFRHMEDLANMNLYQLRLCYQAFITVGKTRVALDPVVSAPIYGKSNELTINSLCSCSSRMSGGDRIILLCEKVVKKNIEIHFFETNDKGEKIWKDVGEFTDGDVHHQTAIAFKTPRYHNPEAQHSVEVELQLFRPSDGATSDPLPFEYYPNPETLSQRCRQNAKNSTESFKRKYPGILNQNFKQSRMLPIETLTVPQLPWPFVNISTGQDTNNLSPKSTYGTDIKYEQPSYQMDATSICPTVASPSNCTNFPLSPSSSCSSYPPMQQQQQHHQQQQQHHHQQQQQQQLQQQFPEPNCVASPSNCTNYSLSPSSSCSNTATYHPMTTFQLPQQQQQQQQQLQFPEPSCPDEQDLTNSLGHLTMTDNNPFLTTFDDRIVCQQFNGNATDFNGGSITNLLNTNINNLNNMNNNNVFSPNMNTSPHYMHYDQTVQQVSPQTEVQPLPQQEQSTEPELPLQIGSSFLSDILKDNNVDSDIMKEFLEQLQSK